MFVWMIIVCGITFLVVPIAITFEIFLGQPKTKLTNMAGFLTVKPLILTPIWIFLSSQFAGYNARFGSAVDAG